MLVSTANAVSAGWVPAGDDGIIATRGWDVLSAHTPNVGQYSEAGLVIHGQVLHSPGPMLYWLIALPARFGTVTSIALTMGIVNTLAIIGCVALARRRGGLVLMFAAAIGIALLCQSLPSEALHDIWNPAAGLFPFLLLIFLGWSVACGDVGLLPAHRARRELRRADAPDVRAADRRAARGRRVRADRLALARAPPPRARAAPPRGAAGAAHLAVGARRAAVAAACWTPPAIDEIENNPGNLTLIVRTIEHRGPSSARTVGWNAIVRTSASRPWWLYVPATEWDRKYDVGALARARGEHGVGAERRRDGRPRS